MAHESASKMNFKCFRKEACLTLLKRMRKKYSWANAGMRCSNIFNTVRYCSFNSEYGIKPSLVNTENHIEKWTTSNYFIGLDIYVKACEMFKKLKYLESNNLHTIGAKCAEESGMLEV